MTTLARILCWLLGHRWRTWEDPKTRTVVWPYCHRCKRTSPPWMPYESGEPR